MRSYIYTRWDGTQHAFSLQREEVVDQFMENIMKGMSPGMSLAQMLWEGFPLAGMQFRVMSLEEMVSALKEQLQELFSQYSLEKAFDAPMDDMEHLLDQEASTRREQSLPPPPSSEELPPGLVEKLRSLKDYDFVSEESREILDNWLDRENDILDLYEFYSQYHHRFTGDQYLDFDEAVALMRQFQSIEDLKEQILRGQLSSIDLQTMRRILGDQAGDSFMILLQLPDILTEEGLVQLGRRRYELTPRGIRALGERAFGTLYRQMKKDRQGGHLGNAPQTGEVEPDSSRPYRFGDRFDLDIPRTILSAVKRKPAGADIVLSPDDFYVREREQLITSTTLVLLDLSWSMSYGGRFEAAKRVALALDHYIRTRFPKDTVHVVGFSTEAHELRGNELALATWDAINPFTNLQAALRLAMQFIRRSGNRNNRVLVITDGQPTAYYIGNQLHVELPAHMFGLSREACMATLAEVRKVTAQGMHIEIFMLDDSPVLVEFTRQITMINGGRSVLCVPDELGRLIIREEIRRRGGR
jgi:uncharacterized protein with von Willebrand factor type A (vWA) domain